MKSLTIITTVTLASALLTGCNTKPKVAESDQTPHYQDERLVIHHLSADTSNLKLASAEIDFSNKTGRSLSYVMFKTTAYDHQGKVVAAKKSGAQNAYLRIAGPIEDSNRTGTNRWDSVWTHRQVACFKIDSAEVIFSDSSVEDFSLEQIEMDLAVLPPSICQHDTEALAAN